MTVHSYEKFY